MLNSWIASVPWLPVTLVALWMGGIVLLAEVLNHFNKADSEKVRKVVHIGVGNVILFAWWWQIPAWIGMGASGVAGAIALLSYRFPILPGINSVGRKSWGTFFYAVSIGLLIACFWEQYPAFAMLGVLVMTWGDGLAALFGQRFGRHPYKLWDMQKSWEGSGMMTLISFVVSGAILGTVYGWQWPVGAIALLTALTATALEAFSKFGIDNLTVPVGSATVAFLLANLWGLI